MMQTPHLETPVEGAPGAMPKGSNIDHRESGFDELAQSTSNFDTQTRDDTETATTNEHVPGFVVVGGSS